MEKYNASQQLAETALSVVMAKWGTEAIAERNALQKRVAQLEKELFQLEHENKYLRDYYLRYTDEDYDSDEYPEVVELEDAPEGMACEDIDGKLIEIGDTVKITIGASERTFIVSMISYFGFEDRSQTEVWAEPGYMLDDSEGTGYVHASECRVVE